MDKTMELPSTDKKRLAGHRVPRRAIVPLLLIAGLAAWWYYSSFAVPAPVGIPASGSIEAEEVSISSELAGRVTQLLAEEGDQVKAGDVLVKLD
ncbi:MAG TPA: biotin/lipoyl-binding protein, partial [Chloroflexota bacterium]|nr:biotin/lipoyl-binding protein [Chloroflexota bacterium]